MPKHLARINALAFLTLGLISPNCLSAQTITAASLEQWFRSGFEFSWESGQPMRDEVRQVWGKLGREGIGYGFRTFQVREGTPPAESIPRMEYWRVTLDDLHTSLVGNIGLAAAGDRTRTLYQHANVEWAAVGESPLSP